jgi:hypothetical protein
MSNDTAMLLCAIALGFIMQSYWLWCMYQSITTMLLKIQANDLERMIEEQNAKKAAKDALMNPRE